MISNKLREYIKEVLSSRPLDIYSEEEETVSHSAYELLTSRKDVSYLKDEDDYFDEEGNDLTKTIGSANLFVAATLVCKESTDKYYTSELTDEEKISFDNEWENFLQSLIDERFMREIKLVAQSKIKLIVNNE
jgi:hypothetical protein